MVTRVAAHRDALQLGSRADIDHVGRRGEALLHGRDQRLPAGEVARVGTGGKERGGLGEGRGTVVAGLVHGLVLAQPAIAAAPALIDLTMF